MGVSKVVYGDDTLVDLTGDTVTPTSLTLGATAHGADGEPIVGEYQYVLPPMSDTIRGGARIQPNSGLEITDTDNLQVRLALESDGTVRGGIAELTAKGHAEQVSTTGKNLLDSNSIVIGKAWEGTSSAINGYVAIPVQASTQYTYSAQSEYGATAVYLRTDAPRFISSEMVDGGKTITTPSECSEIRIQFTTARDSHGSTVSNPPNFAASMVTNSQLELGSTATEYEPYTGGAPSPSPEFPQTIEAVRGHEVTGKTGRFVDLEVRDANDQLLSTTPIPLPQRGWVAGLPDGTADSLMLDGAGKCEWELDSSLTVHSSCSAAYGTRVSVDETHIAKAFDNYSVPCVMCSHLIAFPAGNLESYNGSGITINDVGQIIIKVNGITGKTAYDEWLQSNPITVLYPLATPVTEDCGYVDDWPTDIPEGATLSIRELDSVGIKYFIDSSVTELAKQWAARLTEELGTAVVELAQRVSQLENA